MSLGRLWQLLSILLLAAALAVPASANALNDPPVLPPQPYPSRGSLVLSPPEKFCSEAERQASIAKAEAALKLIEADADRARAYFIALRQSLGHYQAAKNQPAVDRMMRCCGSSNMART
jgi:hypothetical protein